MPDDAYEFTVSDLEVNIAQGPDDLMAVSFVFNEWTRNKTANRFAQCYETWVQATNAVALTQPLNLDCRFHESDNVSESVFKTPKTVDRYQQECSAYNCGDTDVLPIKRLTGQRGAEAV